MDGWTTIPTGATPQPTPQQLTPAPHITLAPYLTPEGELDFGNPEVQRLLQRFSSQMLGAHSYMINATCTAPQDVVLHGARFEDQERVAAEVERHRAAIAAGKELKQPNEEYNSYLEACQARKDRIQAAQKAWRDAIMQSKVAQLQWKQYVADLHAAYVRARDEPAPRNPAV